MASFKISNGSSSAIVTGDMRRYVERVLNETQSSTVKALREAGDEVQRAAKASWYTQVTEETGKSGDIRTVITVSPESGDVSVAVGSVDDRSAKGRPAVVFVHAPFPGSLVQTLVSESEYLASLPAERAWIDHKRKKFYVWRAPKVPATGKYLLEDLVKKPMRAKAKQIAKLIQDGAVKAAGGKNG